MRFSLVAVNNATLTLVDRVKERLKELAFGSHVTLSRCPWLCHRPQPPHADPLAPTLDAHRPSNLCIPFCRHDNRRRATSHPRPDPSVSSPPPGLPSRRPLAICLHPLPLRTRPAAGHRRSIHALAPSRPRPCHFHALQTSRHGLAHRFCVRREGLPLHPRVHPRRQQPHLQVPLLVLVYSLLISPCSIFLQT
jgi:hypothetical protein